MVMLNEVFGGDYLAQADLEQPMLLKISGARVVEFEEGKEKKIALSFSDQEKDLVLNKTNSHTIADYIGSEDTDTWIGKPVVLYRDTTDFGGKRVPCIRVRKPKGYQGANEVQHEDVPF